MSRETPLNTTTRPQRSAHTERPGATARDFFNLNKSQADRELYKQVEDCLISICKDLDRGQLHGDAALSSVLNIDDTEFRLFVHQLEDQFCLFIPERDYHQLTHLDAVAAYIRARL